MGKVIKWIKKPKIPFYALVLYIDNIIPCGLPDKLVVKAKFYLVLGYDLDLNHPRTFNEKLNWLKLYDRNPLYTILVDKVKVKEYVANIIGNEYVIPTFGVWDSPDEIDFEKLPNQFVLKCNHNSGIGLFICKNKDGVTPEKWEEVKEELRRGLKENYYKRNREWPYKEVSRKILAEEYLEDMKIGDLEDYKFFCFDGVVKTLFLGSDCHSDDELKMFDFFNADFRHLDIRDGHPNSSEIFAKPETFARMKEFVEKLSKDIPHVKVDFYEVNGANYFGELSFSHWGGWAKYEPEKWDRDFGKWIDLSKLGGGKWFVGYGFAIFIHENTGENEALTDYKFFCFGGGSYIMYMSKDHSLIQTTDFFDMEFNKINKRMKDPSSAPPMKPSCFEEMRELSQKISAGIPKVRTDFYIINNQIYSGELTFFHNSGITKTGLDECNNILGSKIVLPTKRGGLIFHIDNRGKVAAKVYSAQPIYDLKFYCFNGEPRIVLISSGRQDNKLCFDYYDMQWNKLNLIWDKPNSKIVRKSPPANFDKMKDICRKLTKNIPHARIDLYEVCGKIFFGEFTFFDNAGYTHIEPSEWGDIIGNMIELP
jgi:hypothetical protein